MEWSWCKDFCPELATFNRVFEIRQGKGLLNHMQLVGDKRQIKYCVENERKYFESIGKKAGSHEANLDIIFVNSGEYNGPKNIFDISACKVPSKYIDIVRQTGLKFNEDDLDRLIGKHDLSDFAKDVIINNILLTHYGNSDDELLYATDFSWAPLKDNGKEKSDNKKAVEVKPIEEKPVETIKETETESDDIPTPETEVKAPQKKEVVDHSNEEGYKEWKASDNSRFQNAGSKDLGKPNFTDRSAKMTSIEKPIDKEVEIPNPVKAAKTEKPEKKQETAAEKTYEDILKEDDDKPNYSKPEKQPPKPEIKRNENSMIVKEVITAKENETNKLLLKDLEAAYTEVRELIDNTGDSRFRIIGNKMADMMKNKTYGKIQWCKQYLELSDDVTTELYAKLYNLDKQTKKFTREVVHQVEHMGCPVCGKEWDEDVTFLRPGIHYISCPNCDAERAYEKEEPKE